MFGVFQAERSSLTDFADISTDSINSDLTALEKSVESPPTPGTPITHADDVKTLPATAAPPQIVPMQYSQQLCVY